MHDQREFGKDILETRHRHQGMHLEVDMAGGLCPAVCGVLAQKIAVVKSGRNARQEDVEYNFGV